MDALNYSR